MRELGVQNDANATKLIIWDYFSGLRQYTSQFFRIISGHNLFKTNLGQGIMSYWQDWTGVSMPDSHILNCNHKVSFGKILPIAIDDQTASASCLSIFEV
ncbi:MAG: hypothetical protein RNU03_13710 [Candidatus Sedimenticola sp. (ex Thyasira tokunagai)]